MAPLRLGTLPVISSRVTNICMLTVSSGVASTILRTDGLLLLYAKPRSIWFTWKKSLALLCSKIGTFSRKPLIISKSANFSVVIAKCVGPVYNGVLSKAFL